MKLATKIETIILLLIYFIAGALIMIGIYNLMRFKGEIGTASYTEVKPMPTISN